MWQTARAAPAGQTRASSGGSPRIGGLLDCVPDRRAHAGQALLEARRPGEAAADAQVAAVAFVDRAQVAGHHGDALAEAGLVDRQRVAVSVEADPDQEPAVGR